MDYIVHWADPILLLWLLPAEVRRWLAPIISCTDIFQYITPTTNYTFQTHCSLHYLPGLQRQKTSNKSPRTKVSSPFSYFQVVYGLDISCWIYYNIYLVVDLTTKFLFLTNILPPFSYDYQRFLFKIFSKKSIFKIGNDFLACRISDKFLILIFMKSFTI